MAAGVATVKQVISGDTFVLVGAPKGGPPPEKQITLASLMSPRVAMKSLTKETEDEPYGWNSREFMRERLIGKEVEFKVEYSLGERECGWIKVKGGESASLDLLRKGLARVKSNRNPPCAHDIDELIAAENVAKEAKLGLWNDEPGSGLATIREITWGSTNAAALKTLYNDEKCKRLKAIVEYVRDGGCMRVMFADKWIYATVFVSGVACDGFKREQKEGSEDSVIVPEPFAAEGKFFAEIRVLHRDVEIRLENLDDNGDLYGSIYHSSGNIGVLLLKNGLAKVQEWSARLTESPAQLREAAKEAQSKQLRKWKNWVPSVQADEKEYSARVVEVLSGDCIIIHVPATTGATSAAGEKRVYLASIRCPRVGTRMKPDEPWSFEAREFVRKRLIHKTVKVVVEYIREPMSSASGAPPPPGSDTQGRMHFVTMTVDNDKSSISEQLVTAGLARTQQHRADDDRAENFDTLMEQEKVAEEQGLGVHGAEKNVPKHKINDLLGPSNTARARSFEDQLKRLPKADAVVEYIFNGGRFKLRLPSQNLAISFALGGIRCPQTARTGGPGQGPSRPGEPFSEEALRHARDTLMQRDVTVRIQQCDKGGNFIGALWMGKTNYGSEILELGYGCTMDYSLSFSPYKEEYVEAEKKAQASKLRVWSIPGAIAKHAGTADGADLEKALEEKLPVVTIGHINSVKDFFVQDASNNNAAITTVSKLLAAYKNQDSIESQFTPAGLPKKGDVVIAKFSLDDHWYRARVEGRDNASGDYNLTYIDFGNTETVSLIKLRRLPANVSLTACPPVGKQCGLSGLLEPTDMEDDAAQFFHDQTEGKILKCQVENIDNLTRRRQVVITEQEAAAASPNASSVNELLMRNGLARLDKKSNTKIFTRLKREEDAARKHRINVWTYGDVGDDDENDEDFPSLANGRRPSAAKA
eukprot:GHVQ01018087.1.p1 GENE.GHVQ01018087.1~~GHVQ01018087.1.p1  ORF type:complete len:928 (+),score=129.47 GHVQ01018087.1:195-2978(+)